MKTKYLNLVNYSEKALRFRIYFNLSNLMIIRKPEINLYNKQIIQYIYQYQKKKGNTEYTTNNSFLFSQIYLYTSITAI